MNDFNIESHPGTSSREIARLIGAPTTAARITTTPRTDAPAAMPFAAIASQLDQAVSLDEGARDRLRAIAMGVTRQWLFDQDLPVATAAELHAALEAPTVASKGGTVARAFWWGWHVEISHGDLVTFLSTATTVNTIVGTIGGGIPSPAQPFIALAAVFVKGALQLLQGLDRGRGVYISMSWFAPGVFVPTSV